MASGGVLACIQRHFASMAVRYAGFERFYPKNKPTRAARPAKSGKGTQKFYCSPIGVLLPLLALSLLLQQVQDSACCVLFAAGKNPENETKPGRENVQQFNVLQQLLITAGLVAAIAIVSGMGRPDVQEISFQHFKTHLLAKEAIEKLEVTNKTLVKVYLRQGVHRWVLKT